MQTADVSGKRKRVSKGQSSTGCTTCIPSRFIFRESSNAAVLPAATRGGAIPRPALHIKPVPTHSSTYEREARLTLSAASEPAIKHALASLDTLRRVHAQRESSSAAEQMTTSLQHGIQEYTYSLGALATRLADNEVATRNAALLCCQMFISIETALNNFTSAIQHFVRGVQIMHQYGRPSSDMMNEMPNVDLFPIKMFLTCPDRLFTFPSESLSNVEMAQQMVDDLGRPNLCQSMLHARQQLASISIAVISLLERAREQTPVELIASAQAEQLQLLDHLGEWRNLFAPVLDLATESTPLNARLAALFTMLFYCILRFSLNMAFQHLSLDTEALKAELDEMAWVASLLTQLKPV